jgi:hypothetical protein
MAMAMKKRSLQDARNRFKRSVTPSPVTPSIAPPSLSPYSSLPIERIKSGKKIIVPICSSYEMSPGLHPFKLEVKCALADILRNYFTHSQEEGLEGLKEYMLETRIEKQMYKDHKYLGDVLIDWAKGIGKALDSCLVTLLSSMEPDVAQLSSTLINRLCDTLYYDFWSFVLCSPEDYTMLRDKIIHQLGHLCPLVFPNESTFNIIPSDSVSAKTVWWVRGIEFDLHMPPAIFRQDKDIYRLEYLLTLSIKAVILPSAKNNARVIKYELDC